MSDKKPEKILVVDDEPDVTELLSYTLKAKGFMVEVLNEPNACIDLARSFQPDLIILDVMMPELSGIQICRMLRASASLKTVPVLFLTAKAEEADRVQGLEVGADDYVSKPFSTKELVLRVQSILRRSREGRRVEVPILEAGEIALDVARHEVRLKGAPLELTATEFRLLHLLMERRGRVQSREHLLLNVWNYEAEIETRTVDTHVRRLREKLADQADWIETVRGVGYRFAAQRVESGSGTHSSAQVAGSGRTAAKAPAARAGAEQP
ncbi:response regulator [Cephaloticoccus primus]|uniref:response regulator n=1 Tax=Cephaloticoccus primus TaxID=1548207 RepID=UPI0008394F09|nr:response regulator transcription factor [Cephaloticoccus primus]